MGLLALVMDLAVVALLQCPMCAIVSRRTQSGKPENGEVAMAVMEVAMAVTEVAAVVAATGAGAAAAGSSMAYLEGEAGGGGGRLDWGIRVHPYLYILDFGLRGLSTRMRVG